MISSSELAVDFLQTHAINEIWTKMADGVPKQGRNMQQVNKKGILTHLNPLSHIQNPKLVFVSLF